MEENKDLLTTRQLIEKMSATGDITKFVKKYQNSICTQSFSDYLHEQCESKGMLMSEVIKRADIEKSYGYMIFKGNRQPSRDRVIQLAFGFGMDGDEAQRLLLMAGKPQLYAKILRELTILYCLDNHMSIVDTQLLLGQMGLELIGGVKND